MSYFEEGEGRGADIRIVPSGDLPELSLVDGIRAKPVVGERMNIQEVTLDPLAVAPVHTHDEEQLGYVVSGACEFTDGKATWRLGPGDCYFAPSGAPHGATALEDGCVIVDAFTPPRAQILAALAGWDER